MFEVWNAYSNTVPTFLHITNKTQITGDPTLSIQSLKVGDDQLSCVSKCEKSISNCVFLLYVSSDKTCYFYGSNQQVKDYSKFSGVNLFIDWTRSKKLAA